MRLMETMALFVAAATGISRRRFFAAHATQYTIDCPPTDYDHLTKIVTKHLNHLDTYLASRPLAKHTVAAYEALVAQVPNLATQGIVLDSGCGTGKSSLRLGKMHPDRLVVGVDRSVARLSKSTANADAQQVEFVADNVVLVRADLVDFWQCPLTVHEHYLLYPNPYPKKSRLQSRWYAHPAWPLVLQNMGQRLVVRSNWKQFLVECASATKIMQEVLREQTGLVPGLDSEKWKWEEPQLRLPADPWTNFEAKYDLVGEETFEWTLEKR